MRTEAGATILGAIDCTRRLKDECDLGLLRIPATRRGKEKFSLQVGAKVKSTGKGLYKRGVVGKVVSREKNNGFNRYYVKWENGSKNPTGEREQDIEPTQRNE